MEVDFLIIGQGIAGTLLSFLLRERGKTITVVERPDSRTGSSVFSSALINPYTIREVREGSVRASRHPWIIAALGTYASIEQCLGIDVVQELDMVLQARELEDGRYGETGWELVMPDAIGLGDGVRDPARQLAKRSPLWRVNEQELLLAWSAHLETEGLLVRTNFDLDEAIYDDASGSWAFGDVRAKGIICCGGAGPRGIKGFEALPFTPNQGDVLLLDIPGLPRRFVYQLGPTRLVPWGKEDRFWCGSNYRWDACTEPDKAWAERALDDIRARIGLPIETIEHALAPRPTTAGQFPFMGWHPHRPGLGIFNGLGTRGFSNGPFWAIAFADYLCGRTAKIEGYHLERFEKFFPGPK